MSLRGEVLATKQSDEVVARNKVTTQSQNNRFKKTKIAARSLAIMFMALAGSVLAQTAPETPRLGKPITAEEAAKWDLNVFPDGEGLPEGRGSAIEGKVIYDAKCASCHGEGGRGATAEELAGGTNQLKSKTPDKTIGLYWPYATTLFDFTRRSMPMNAPGSLTNDELYAVTAYLLFANKIIGERDEMNAKTLPRVRMPNREGFIWIDAKPGIGK